MHRRIFVTLSCLVATGALLFGQNPDPTEAQARAAPRAGIAAKGAEDPGYEHRYPTPEEVTEMEKDWKEKNPFKFSAYMPDFSKHKILVRKAEKEPAASSAQTRELTDRVAALEQQLAQAQATAKPPTPVATPSKEKTVSAQPKTDKPVQSPREPNPSNIVLRKMADGRVVAIIGGKMISFATEKEAKAYIAKLKP